jgi:hypothetical protein
MSSSVAVTFIITADFSPDVLKGTLERFKATSKTPTNKYQVAFWSVNDLSIMQYEKTVVVQGSLNKFTKDVLWTIANMKGLTTDSKNDEKLRTIFPSQQNAVICGKCREDSLEIVGKIVGLDVEFSMECGHNINLIAPFVTLNNRILPDINMLVSKSISRLIGMGHLKGVEIVFPEFILETVDQIKGTGIKIPVTEELDELRKLAKDGIISINTFPNLPLTYTIKSKDDEDKVILDFAHFTNSILMTGDKILKERSLMECRPTIFIAPEDFGKIKTIDEVRK